MTLACPVRYHPDFPNFGSAWHSDYSADDPSWVAASVANHQNGTLDARGYSTDGGYTWTAWPTLPLGAVAGQTGQGTGVFGFGSIHVGAPGTVVWVSSYSHGVQRTTNYGTTWTAVTMPGVANLGSSINPKQYYIYRRPLASEKTAGQTGTFYAHVNGIGFFRTSDAGATWSQQCDWSPFSGTDYTWHEYLKSVPDNPGHLFLTAGPLGSKAAPDTTTPFLRTADGGATWAAIPDLMSVRGFDFGKAAPGQSYPAIYVIGILSGVTGVYRSIDGAVTWDLLSQQPAETVAYIRNVAASKDTYGLHWLTAPGGGILRGQLATA